MTAQACAVPGCTGTIEDGYCNVCGTPAGDPRPAPPSVPAPTGAAAAPTGGPDSQRISTRTSSRLASAPIGSARTGTQGSRRTATVATRLRGQRLGAGLTRVPPAPLTDPLKAVLAKAEVAEAKRYCPSCGSPVGRSRDGAPGRTSGFCPKCGSAFDFDPQLTAGDLLGGQYEVVGPIAHGGLGWIYLARDKNVSGRFVVLKGLLNSGDKDAYEAAIAEREFLAEVEHPLIVEIYNFVMHGDAGYTVMEYVGGRSIKEILKDRQAEHGGAVTPLPVDQALAYILEILPAFAYLHERGLIYCDFKPDNMIQQGEGMKLIDLGGVRRATDETSAIFGTVGYQAPEVPTEGPSVASDIYTIGRTLAVMVLDFRGNTSTYVSSLPPVSETPLFQQYDSFYRLLAKACAPAAADRFGSIDEMRAQVLGVLREVVAAGQSAGAAPLPPAASPNFEAPVADPVERPLTWDELPALRVDAGDEMAQWLAGVTDGPNGRLAALRRAPLDTREVKLARIRAAIAEESGAVPGAIAEVLAEDPWEWRALWLQGLHQLSLGAVIEARASFNSVYGQVPGELAPKLALAATCEASAELDVAAQLYLVCAAADANYTAPAAFGLARIRTRRQDTPGALAALDLVPATRASFPRARVRRAVLLLATADDPGDATEALAGIANVQVEPGARLDLEIAAFTSALAHVLRSGPAQATVGGVAVQERPLRAALESAYRSRARMVGSAAERIELVDRANAIRPRTLT